MPTPTITLRVPADDQPLMREVAARLKNDPVFRSSLQALVQGEAGSTPDRSPMERLADVVDQLASIADRLTTVPRWGTGRHPTRSTARDVDPAEPDHIRFRRLREALGMRQEDAATLFERARPTIAYWENPTEGRPTVPRYALLLLELLLAVPPAAREAVCAGGPAPDTVTVETDAEGTVEDLEPREWLRRELALLEMSQRQAAGLARCTEAAMSQWCSGARPVPAWLPRLLQLYRLVPSTKRGRAFGEIG